MNEPIIVLHSISTVSCELFRMCMTSWLSFGQKFCSRQIAQISEGERLSLSCFIFINVFAETYLTFGVINSVNKCFKNVDGLYYGRSLVYNVETGNGTI